MPAKRAPVRAVDPKSDIVRDPFVYTVGDVEITLPSLSYLKPGLVRRLRRMNGTDQMYTLFEETLGEDSPEMRAIDEMDPDEFDAMREQWHKHSGIDMGKSAASTS
ncbi:hypothetical protein [Nocardia sp. CA-290969]|uniref:hypothetical protein n=1 Tax=Nocardia sp. CA-290969 TaxID=3239986 RepID=UPI003D94D380